MLVELQNSRKGISVDAVPSSFSLFQTHNFRIGEHGFGLKVNQNPLSASDLLV